MKALLLSPLAFVQLLYQSVYLALGQIWANKTRSILTTIGIVIGVASVTAVIAALTGLKAKVLADFESFGSNTIIIQPRRPDTGPLSHLPWWHIRFSPEELEGMLEHCPSVELLSRISWGGDDTIRNGEKSVEEVMVNGIEPSWHEIHNRPVVMGRMFSVIDEMHGRQVCIIEPRLRDELGLDRDCIGQQIVVGRRTFCIVGLLEGHHSLELLGGGRDYSEILIPFSTNFKRSRYPWISAVAASKSTELSEEAQAEIKFFLRRARRIGPGEPDTFRVESIESYVKKFNQIAIMITMVAGGIVGISLLVGGVGIMNIMLVSISERTREIGLRKAVGAKKSAILTQFLIEAVVLCFVGGIVGVGVGQLLTLLITKINPVLDKTYIPAWAIVLSFGFAGSVGIFFGMFPAVKAARLDPIEALRHE